VQEPESAAPAPVVVASDQDKAAAAGDDPLGGLYQKLMDMPESPEREMVIQTLQQLAAETQKGEEAEEGKVESMVKTVVQVLPDVAEVTINTMINPASGLLTLVQKVAKRVASGQSEEADEKPPQEEEAKVEQEAQADEPVQVDAEAAAEALEEVRDQLAAQPDSPEKELVEETLERLETESTETQETKDEGETLKDKVAEAINGVAEVLPDVAEAAVEVVAVVGKQAAKDSDQKG
jgi:predicted GTPase